MPNKVAVVTGAATGIGRAIAIRLAKDGFEVALCDLSQQQQALDAACQEITQAHPGTRVSNVIADVSKEADVEAMIATVVKDHGGLDVMVANAGIFMIKSVIDTSVEDWDRLFSVNARGVFLCYKHAGRQMISQGRGGRIIGACSGAGKQGTAHMATYCATKFAVRGLIQATAIELGSHGITVNAYAPGAVNTTIFKHVTDNIEGFLEEDKVNTALKMIGQPEDIAGLVSYLASPESRFMTGQTVTIDGGRHYD